MNKRASFFFMPQILLLRRCVFREIFVAVGVFDGAFRVLQSQTLGGGLPVSIIGGSGHDAEMTHFMDERSRFRIRAGRRRAPEGVAQVNRVRLV